MKMNPGIIIVMVLTVLILTGCQAAPIQNIVNEPFKMSRSNHTIDDVAKAILRAGSLTSWHMEKDKPGVIIATYFGPISGGKAEYSASVTIKFSRTNYSIQYRNSTSNLQYESGEIHKNYNEWVQNLSNAIQRELLVYSG
jgi:hypothetical protein